MLKSALALAGIALALAFLAPSFLTPLVERPETAAVNIPADPAPPPAAGDMGGHVRLQADPRGHYATDIEVDNRTLHALVDTGATVVALRYEDGRRLGLVHPGDRYDVQVRTANGIGRARRVELREVRVGPIAIRNVEALVMEPDALGVNLLGMSFLRRLSRFEVQRGTLVLER